MSTRRLLIGAHQFIGASAILLGDGGLHAVRLPEVAIG